MNTPNRRDRWKVRVQKDRKLAAETRLFLVATLAPKMKADGKVSQPRSRLAAAAGVSERMVTKYIKQAKDAGWLVVVQAGYRTMTAVYQASFPDQNGGTAGFPLSEEKRGNYKDPLSAGTAGFPLSPEERGNRRVPTTSSSTTRTPLRVVPNNRHLAHRPVPSLPSLRLSVADLTTIQADACMRTMNRTQPKPVERHRHIGLVAAPVEIHASGAVPATRFVFCPTRPQRKAHR